MVIDTRTPTPLPSPSFTPSVTPIPSATQTPTFTIPPDLTQNGDGILPSLFGETMIITSTNVQTMTIAFADVNIARSGSIHQMAWAPAGNLIAAGTSSGIYIFDATTLERINALSIGDSINSLLISPNIGLLVSGGRNGDIQWRDAANGWVWATFEGHSIGISDLALSFQGDFLVSGSDDGSVRIWSTSDVMDSNTDHYVPLYIWETNYRVSCVDIRWDGQVSVAGSYETAFAWDSETGEEIITIEGLAGWVNDLAFDPDGLSLAIADSSNHIQIWDTTTWQQTHNIELEQLNQLSALSFNPSGEILAVGGRDGSLILWDLLENTMNVLENYPHEVTSLAFSPGGEQLVSSYQNGVWRMWDFNPTNPSEKGDPYEKE
jgi:WD40 repeat protein